MKKFTKLLAVLLSIALIIGAIPSFAVSAEEDGSSALNGTMGHATYLFTGDEADYAGYAEGIVTLSGLSEGYYALYWADSNGVLENYEHIITVAADANGTDVTYAFPEHIAIPTEANALAVYSCAELSEERFGFGSTANSSYYYPSLSDEQLELSNAYDIIALPASKLDKSTSEFKFAALSDAHMNYTHAQYKLTRALKWLSTQGISHATMAGDVSDAGASSEIMNYRMAIEQAGWDPANVYECSGNHETTNLGNWQKYAMGNGKGKYYVALGDYGKDYNTSYSIGANSYTINSNNSLTVNGEAVSENIEYHDKNFDAEAYANVSATSVGTTNDLLKITTADGESYLSPWYYVVVEGENGAKNNVVICLSQIMDATSHSSSYDCFTDEEMSWFENTLSLLTKTNSNIYVLEHANYAYQESGDPRNKYAQPINTGKTNNDKFYSLMRQFPECMWMHGHTHTSFYINAAYPTLCYQDDNGQSARSIHVSSTSQPRFYGTSGGMIYIYNHIISEGYVVDVHSNNIYYKGTNFYTEKFIPTACLVVDSRVENRDSAVSIEVTKLPDNTTLKYGYDFNYSGIEVTATFKDGTRRLVEGYEFPQFIKKVDKYCTEVTVVYGNCSTTYPVSFSCNHSWDSETVAPTCGTDGYTLRTCKYCTYQVQINPTPATGHFYTGDNYTVTTPATCTTDGELSYVCEGCGETFTEAIPMLNHDYVSTVTTPATCTADGVLTYTCSRCGDSYTEVIPQTGHDYEITTTAATCTTDGLSTFVCKTCGDTYETVLPSLGHKYNSETTLAATCTETGIKTYTCERCGDSYTTEIKALGHSYTNEITTPSTCVVEGVETYTCSVCGDSYIKAIPMIPHNYEKSIDTEATCTTVATIRYTCSLCGDTYTEQGNYFKHNYQVTTVSTGANYSRYNLVCSVCGEAHDNVFSLQSDGNYSGGNGSEDYPYIIATPDDFKALTDKFTKTASDTAYYYKQIANIDMSGVENYEGTNSSGTNTTLFTGKYDGDGHTITVNIVSANNNVSIFPYIRGGAIIKNLTFAGHIESTTSGGYVQPIRTVGTSTIANDAYVINCTNKMEMAGPSTVNGMCQSLYAVCINYYCEATALTKMNGLANTRKNATITNCYYDLTIPEGITITDGGAKKSDDANVLQKFNEYVAADTTYGLKAWSTDSDFLTMAGGNLCYEAGHIYENGICTVCETALSDSDMPFIYGDANCDGKITLTDAAYLSRNVADWDGYGIDELLCDMNDDTVVDVYDVYIILKTLSN